jgi:hypothetical protein
MCSGKQNERFGFCITGPRTWFWSRKRKGVEGLRRLSVVGLRPFLERFDNSVQGLTPKILNFSKFILKLNGK